MSKEQTYTQCKLSKSCNTPEAGVFIDIAWIPSEFAVVGKSLKIKQEDESWEDGWVVETVYSTVTHAYIKEHERDFLKQRSASDI